MCEMCVFLFSRLQTCFIDGMPNKDCNYNSTQLTLLFYSGNYDRLEFLGDAILKYVSSDFLYKHYPSHQEGHLTVSCHLIIS